MKMNTKIIMLAIASLVSTQSVFSMDKDQLAQASSEVPGQVSMKVPEVTAVARGRSETRDSIGTSRGASRGRKNPDPRHIVELRRLARSRSRSAVPVVPRPHIEVAQPKESGSYCKKCVLASIRGCSWCCEALADAREKYPVGAAFVTAGCCLACGCSIESSGSALVSMIQRSSGCCSKVAYVLGVCLCAKACKDCKKDFRR